MIGDGVWCLGHVRGEDRLGCGPGERRAARQQLVGQGTYGIDVRPMVDVRIGRCLLGRHVCRCPQRHTGGGQPLPPGGLAHRFRDAEVRNQGVPPRQHHVVGLDVAMHDALAVRVVQCIDHIAENPYGFGNRQFPFPREFLA